MPIGYQHPVVVLGLFDTGLGVVRSLARNGVRVVGVDYDRGNPGVHSRLCDVVMGPDPEVDAEGLLALLLEIAEPFDVPVVIMPTSDAHTLFLSRYRRQLAEQYLFALPAEEVIEAMIDKSRMLCYAMQLGVPTATTHFPASMEEVLVVKDEIDYPAFIKPHVGYRWRERFGGSKGIKVCSPDELVAKYELILPTGLRFMVQEIIQGPNTNHYKVNVYMSAEGEPLAVFTLRKIHQYPAEFGVGSCVESVVAPDLVDLAMPFFEGIDYRGVGSIEFKLDDRDGMTKMIELNPRFWQQHFLATECGVNFALIEYRDLVGEHQDPVTEFEVGRKWLDPPRDFMSYLDHRRLGDTTVREWARSLKGGRRSYPVFAWDDLGPFFAQSWRMAGSGWSLLSAKRG